MEFDTFTKLCLILGGIALILSIIAVRNMPRSEWEKKFFDNFMKIPPDENFMRTFNKSKIMVVFRALIIGGILSWLLLILYLYFVGR